MEERTQIAAMAMQGILSNSETEKYAQEFDVNIIVSFGIEEADKKYAKAIALSAVDFADELILALGKDSGEWNRYSKKEMWEEIQKIRKLVGSDGTESICDDIKSYAENYAENC